MAGIFSFRSKVEILHSTRVYSWGTPQIQGMKNNLLKPRAHYEEMILSDKNTRISVCVCVRVY